MKAIIFSNHFEPPDELVEFCKGIGYNFYNPATRFDLMFDRRVIEFCEKRLTTLWNEKVYKGKTSYFYRVGFAGAGYIRDIDIKRKWMIGYSNVDAPIIKYVDVKINNYGHVALIQEND